MTTTQTDRLYGVTASLAIKSPVKAATTANITLSGEQTIDGVALVDGNRVLVKNQTNTVQNGIWDVGVSSWSRSLDFDGIRDIANGTFVRVTGGTVNGGYAFSITSADPIVIGTDAITFLKTLDFSDTGISTEMEPVVSADTLSSARTELSVYSKADVYSKAETDALIPLVPAEILVNVVIQTFTSSGTYTPTAGMKVCIVDNCGGGGGGGSVSANTTAASSGGAGGFARVLLTATQVGVSQAVTIGAGGAGGTAGGAGAAGGSSSFGSLITTNGGSGGASGSSGGNLGGAGGSSTVSTGSTLISMTGQTGGVSFTSTGISVSTGGGSSLLGSGGASTAAATVSHTGNPATGYGSGGGGAVRGSSGTADAGGAGSDGICIITEYIAQ